MKFDFHFLFSAKYAQWISIALISFFSILILAECSALIFLPMNTKSVLPKTNENLKVIAKQNSLDALLHSSLFGVYVPNHLNESDVRKSMLNVTVVGILLETHANDSQVIIRAAGGDEKNYKLGDEIPGGAVIKRITPTGILVERHGTLESLSLPKNGLTFEPVAPPLKEE